MPRRLLVRPATMTLVGRLLWSPSRWRRLGLLGSAGGVAGRCRCEIRM